MLVSDIVRNNARARGGSVALVVGDATFTYADLQSLVDVTAGALATRGIGTPQC